MISREMLYAILQGLPDKYFEHLDAPWSYIARLINIELKHGADPVSALKSAFARTEGYPRQKIRETLLHVLSVSQIPGLSYRQREALIALRAAKDKTASLAQLCRVLAQDRGNTHRRLSALVQKGLAVKFFQTGGVYYYAIPSPLEKSVKVAVNEFLNHLIAEFSQDASDSPEGSTAPTMPTTPTTPTRSTIST